MAYELIASSCDPLNYTNVHYNTAIAWQNNKAGKLRFYHF